MPDPAVPAAAILAQIRERAAHADRVLAFKVPGNFAEAAARSQADVVPLLAAVERVLELHHPKPVYGLAFGGLNQDKPLCAHDPDTDPDAHFEGDDGYWYCRDRITCHACAQCADEDAADLWAEWPCPTYVAITSALTGAQPAGPPQSGEDRRAAAEALEGLRTRLAGKGDGDADASG
jgi:hypothetical protein